MPSESVSSFLDLARSQRLFPADQVDELVRQPEAPQANLGAFCDFLLDRGVITEYQARVIRSGQGSELTLAGYPLLGEVGPCPGGVAYRALHPSLRTPVVLRRLRADWLSPSDNLAAYVGRAQSAAPIIHPHLVPLLDAVVAQEELYVACEPIDGRDLAALVGDIGPMPAPLAAGYARQIALALQEAHGRHVIHGDIRPENIIVGPLVVMSKPRADGTPRYRPAGNAVVRLAELGLIPRRPPINRWIEADPGLKAELVAYLPPERLDGEAYLPAGDVYGLGATLYFLLTGRPPYAAPDARDVVGALTAGVPAPLAALRPDAPEALIALVESMMARSPSERPTIATVVDRLGAIVTPAASATEPASAPPEATGAVTLIEVPASTPNEVIEAGDVELAPDAGPASDDLLKLMSPTAPPPPQPAQWVAVPYTGPTPATEYTPAAAPAWVATPVPPASDEGQAWSPSESTESSPSTSPRNYQYSDNASGKRIWFWLWVGGGLNVLALLLWCYFFLQPGCSNQDNDSPPPPVKKAKKK